MALTPTEEAQARQLIAQQAALLSLAGNEATITSKLGAAKVNLGQLPAASALADADLLLTRQGVNDRSLTASLLAQYISAELGVTAPQFDNDTSLATTAFVQRAGPLFGVSVAVPATTTLNVADAGKIHALQNSGITATLPSAASVPQGNSFVLWNTAQADSTISAQAGQTIAPGNAGAVQTLAIGGGCAVILVSDGVSSWAAFLKTDLRTTAGFGSSLSASGYQKLPSGLIIQWGNITNSATPGNATLVTFPIVFPSAVRQLVVSSNVNSTSVSAAWYDAQTPSGFNMRSNVATSNASYIAIGN